MSSAIKTPAFQAKAGNIQNEDGSSIYSAGEWSFKNASAVTGFHIASDGKVGIGGTPTVPFEIIKNTTSGSAPDYPNIRLNNQNAAGYSGFYFYHGSVLKAGLEMKNDVGALLFAVGASGTERMRIDASGNLMIGSSIPVGTSGSTGIRPGSTGQLLLFSNSGGLYHQVLFNYYTITTSGGSTSDANLKKDVEILPGCLDKIKSLRGVSFEFIEEPLDDANKGKQIGVIAQEVEAQFPEMVVTNEDGVKAVRYEKLVAPLIEAVKELSAKVDAQAAEIEALKAK